MLSGLANRRGFQNRLDFEWMRAQQYDSELSLLRSTSITSSCSTTPTAIPKVTSASPGSAKRWPASAAETHGLCRALWRRGILYGAAEHRCEAGSGDRRDGPRRGPDLAMPHCTSDYQTVTVSVGVACTVRTNTQRPGDLIEAADAPSCASTRPQRRGRARLWCG